jgi:hypothetical protein
VSSPPCCSSRGSSAAPGRAARVRPRLFYAREQLTFRHTVAPQFVGNQDTRHVLQALQQLLEEPPGCSGIAAALFQNIEYDAVLVDHLPEIMQYTSDPDEHLIQVPSASRSRSSPAQFFGEAPNSRHYYLSRRSRNQ